MRQNMLKHKRDLSKKVINLDTMIEYASIAEASRQTGYNESTITDICHHRRKRPQSHWAFVSELKA